MTITEFLEARIAEGEATPYRLVPYDCKPDCCAPAGWVGRECLICLDGVRYGGTVEAMTDSGEEHAEQVHLRSRLLAECKAKRAIVDEHVTMAEALGLVPSPKRATCWRCCDSGFNEREPSPWPCPTLRALAAAAADHPDYQDAWDI